MPRIWPRVVLCAVVLGLGAAVYVRSEVLSFLRHSQCRHGTTAWATPGSWFCTEARVGMWAGVALMAGALFALAVILWRRRRLPAGT